MGLPSSAAGTERGSERPVLLQVLELRHHPFRLESLSDKEPIEAAEFAFVPTCRTTPPPLRQRRFQQGVLVELLEHRVNGSTRRRGSDAGALDPAPHTLTAAFADTGFAAGNGLGNPGVVEGPFLEQPVDRGVDGAGIVRAAGEPLSELGLGQLAPPEHPEGIEVRPLRIHYEPKRVMVSRLMSAVVEMP